MSRKDYKEIAAAIAAMQVSEQQKREIAEAFIPVFKRDNERFCKDRFLAACVSK